MTPARWRVALWLGMLSFVLWMTWQARAALLPFAVGSIVAYGLAPVVDAISRVPGPGRANETLRRGLAVGLIYAVLGLGVFWIGSIVVPLAADQILEFVDTLPETIEAAQEQGSRWVDRYQRQVPPDVQERLQTYVDDISGEVGTALAAMARGSLATVGDTIGLLFGFAVTPFFVFYALRDRPRAARSFLSAAPDTLREDTQNFLRIADRLLARFLHGQLILGLVVGTAVGVGLTLMGVQLSLGLGVIAGLTELVPVIGPWVGAIPGVLIVLATDPDKVVLVALLYFAVQQLENNLLVPRIQGSATDIHPAMVLILLVVFGAVMGFWGLVIAVPLTAILREAFWYTDARLRGLSPNEAYARARVIRMVESSIREREPAPEPAPEAPGAEEREQRETPVP